MTKPKQPDWNVVRAEYVNGTDTLQYIADKYGVNPATLRKRASVGGWQDARQEFARKVALTLETKTVVSRVSQLKEWNDDDLKIAKVLRSKLAMRLAKVSEETASGLEVLRTIASTVEAVQRVARLALGATTANQGVSNPDGTPINPPSLADLYATLNFVDAASGEVAPDGKPAH